MTTLTDTQPLEQKQMAGDGDGEKTTKKKKNVDSWRPAGRRDPFEMLNSLPEEKQQEIQKALHLFSLAPGLPKTLQQAKKHTYLFWDTQPVVKLDDSITTHGHIIEKVASIREEPFSLPKGFSWDTLDLSDTTLLQELRTLLNDNYMEEDDNSIRFDFSLEYLQWALQPPNWLAQWHCGVRVASNKKLVGFIAAVPADVRIYDTEKKMAQVKLLCVHKRLRLKRMTPVLIRELTRRVALQSLAQAVYTAGTVHPTPISTCSYWQRPLNLRKLMDLNYPGMRRDMTLQRALKINRLPESTKNPGLRPMLKKDVPAVRSLLQSHLRKFDLSPIWSPHEVEHWLLPRDNVMHTYVVEADDSTLTDVVSFYSISSKVLNHPAHTDVKAAHLFYIACSRSNSVDLMEDTLVLAKSKGFDVFCASDAMDNKNFLDKLKFTIVGNSLHYYLYNWMCPKISPDKVGLMLPS
ncbi:glycylpeptide N-tetradecanoyltransferase 1-like [Synchiropus splendidus]|uniref:glycylpeptide N-tetradecanoyltransferase 1-like n=1 Tax=Synchiropus splendidus TaxID=270530 RepID=UPI00237E8B66|nr:glycylpeptide N-tetradecanoyltransferase 1-like [Synchiropus splendidus]